MTMTSEVFMQSWFVFFIFSPLSKPIEKWHNMPDAKKLATEEYNYEGINSLLLMRINIRWEQKHTKASS